MVKAVAAPRKRRAYAPRVPLEERRRQLLDAALRIIARDGYGGITMEAIAKEAGVTKPVVYGAFEKLPKLLGELLDRTQAEALAQLFAAFPRDSSSPPSAGTVALAWMQAVRANPVTWMPILVTGAQVPQAVVDRIEESRSTVRSTVARRLIGERSPDASQRRRLELAAEVLIATAEHFGRALLTRPESIDDELLAELIDDLARRMVAPTV